MVRYVLTLIIVLVLASPLAGGHAFGHAGATTDSATAFSHDHHAHQKCEGSCDDEQPRPCCADALMHCVTFGVEMKFRSVALPIASSEAWNVGAYDLFSGLSSEAEIPPPRI